jgi:hypothetical protein
VLWEGSSVRHRLLSGTGWLETELPELNDQLAVMIGRRPFHEVSRLGIEGKPLPLGYHLALQSWLRRAVAALSKIEAIPVESAERAARLAP